MSLKDFVGKAQGRIEALTPLNQRIRELPRPQWSKLLDRSADTTSDLADLGSVKLTGEISAAAHLTRRSEPPLDLTKIVGDQDETATAWASLVVAGTAGAGLSIEEPIQNGAIRAGAAAGATARWAQHRRVTTAKKGVNAFADLFDNLALIYDPEQVAGIGELDILQAEISGSAAVRADAGWSWGLVRSLEGDTLDALGIGEPLAIAAGVKVGATVTAGIEGELRVVVQHSPKSRPNHPIVVVSLFKRRGAFAGAGIQVTAGLSVTNAVEFVDAVADKVLKIPDDLVGELRQVQGRLEDLQKKIDGLADDLRARVEAAAGKAVGTLRLAELREVLNRPELTPLPVDLGAALRLADQIQAWVDQAQEEVEDGIERVVGDLQAPLGAVVNRVDEWLSAYEAFRTRLLEHVQSRALQGVKLEIEAGINRTWAGESLLDLEIDLALAGADYARAVQGNFAPALKSARAGGSNGVEILSGSLKQITRTDRHFNLGLNLVGFQIQRDLSQWKQLEIAEDVISGELTLVGQAGAELWAQRRSQIRALSFLLDAAGAAEEAGGALHFSRTVGFTGVLVRGSELKKDDHIRKLMPLHLKGAQALRLLGPEDRELLEARILAEPGDYSYELRLSFPEPALRSLFLLDSLGTSQKAAAERLWGEVVRAVEMLDLPVPTGNRICPLSRTFSNQNIDFVRKAKSGDWDRFKPTRVEDYKFEKGQARLIWVYLRESYLFIQSYLEAREALLSGTKAAKQLGKLRQMTANVARPPGALSTMPFDAKYLALALIAGPGAVTINLTVRRGEKLAVSL